MNQAIHGQRVRTKHGIGMRFRIRWRWGWTVAGSGGGCIRGVSGETMRSRSRSMGQVVVKGMVTRERIGLPLAGSLLLIAFLGAFQVLTDTKFHNDRTDLTPFSTSFKLTRESLTVHIIGADIADSGTHSAPALA